MIISEYINTLSILVLSCFTLQTQISRQNPTCTWKHFFPGQRLTCTQRILSHVASVHTALHQHTGVGWVWAGWGRWRGVGLIGMIGVVGGAKTYGAGLGWGRGRMCKEWVDEWVGWVGWVRGWVGGLVGWLVDWLIVWLIDWRGHDTLLPVSNLGNILSLKLLSGSLAKKWRRSCGSCVHASWGRDERVVHGRLNCIMVCHVCLWAAGKTWLQSDPMWSLHVASLCSECSV